MRSFRKAFACFLLLSSALFFTGCGADGWHLVEGKIIDKPSVGIVVIKYHDGTVNVAKIPDWQWWVSFKGQTKSRWVKFDDDLAGGIIEESKP